MKMRLFFCFSLVLALAGCELLGPRTANKSELLKYKFVKQDGLLLDKNFWNEGKTVMYFGFSHCPDMCPLALVNFGRAHLILGPRAREFRFVFITLDPERDAPSLLANYVNQFPGGKLIALSPDNETLPKLLTLFNAVRKKVGSENNYNLDHSNFIYILDSRQDLLLSLPGGTSGNALAKSLRELDFH